MFLSALVLGAIIWLESGQPTQKPIELNKENLSRVLNEVGKGINTNFPKRI